MINRYNVFDYHVNDDISSINKVRVLGSSVTLYFKETSFDDMPDIRVDGFFEATERAKFHEDFHVNDEQRKNAHIHYVSNMSNDNLLVSMQKLSDFFKQLVDTQKKTMERTANCFFKVNPFISETQVASLKSAYETFVSQNRVENTNEGDRDSKNGLNN